MAPRRREGGLVEPLRGAILERLRRLLDLQLEGHVDLTEMDLELEEIARKIRRDAAECTCKACVATREMPWWNQ